MKKSFVPLALSCLAFAAAAHAKSADATLACTPLPGTDALAAAEGPDFILFGEAHGTNELPEAFSDLVCGLTANGVPVTVGLEFLPDEQSALDHYLASDGGIDARKTLLASAGWADRSGRASEAILGVVETLRALKTTGVDIVVIAFDHSSEQPGTSDARETGMAHNLLAARAMRPHARVVALTGIGHAGKSEWTSLGPPFFAMSQHLPQESTAALAFIRGGGEVWACRAPEEGDPEECRAWASTARETFTPRSVTLTQERDGFDGIVSVGRSYTASPPARGTR